MVPNTFSVGVLDTSVESIGTSEITDVFDAQVLPNLSVPTPLSSSDVSSRDNTVVMSESYSPSWSSMSDEDGIEVNPDCLDQTNTATQDNELESLCPVTDHTSETQANAEDLDLDGQHDCEPLPQDDANATFKLVGDNIDKTIKPRDMRIDHQTQSLHYFHSFAVKDRVSFSSLPNTVSLINPAEVDLQCFLPTADDQLVLEENLCVLISRMVVQYIPFFRKCTIKVKQHIDHLYSKEMARKSTVV